MIAAHPQHDTVIVAGGDGTISAAVPALLQRRHRLGIIPLGTANDLARTLQIPLDPGKAAGVIAGGRMHAIDVGMANGIPFLNVASIGLSVHIARRPPSGTAKKRLGVLAYTTTMMQEIRSLRPFTAQIQTTTSRQQVRTVQLSVGNGRYYGMRLQVASHAAADDGTLYLYSISPVALHELVRLGWLLPGGRHISRQEVLLLNDQAFDIQTDSPMPVYTDGEVKTHTPVQFNVLRRCVHIHVPAGYRASDIGDAQDAS